MGGQPSAPSAPAPAPSTTETSAQAIQAQIDALPKILAAQKEYGSQFSEESLKALQEYSGPFAEAALNLEQKYAPQYKAISDILNPEVGAAQKTLTDYLNQTDDQEYNSLAPGVREDIRAGQSQRGLGAISPLGSIDEGVQLARLKSSLKDRRLNIALSTASRTPISGQTQVQGTTGTGQLVQNVNPDSIFGYQGNLNNFNASIFATEADKYQSRQVATTAKNASMSRGALGWII
jgi:hypothetical protein